MLLEEYKSYATEKRDIRTNGPDFDLSEPHFSSQKTGTTLKDPTEFFLTTNTWGILTVCIEKIRSRVQLATPVASTLSSFDLPDAIKDFHRDVYPFIDPSKPELALKDKVVLVTGGGRGIGASIVEAFAKAHAKVIVMTGRSESSLANAKNSLEKAYPETNFIPVSVDISSEDRVNSLYESLKDRFDHIGVLNEFGPKVGETNIDKFWADMTVNTKGPYLLSCGLIKFNPDNYRATFITFTTSINEEFTNVSAYQLSKIPPIKLVQILNAGVVATDSLLDSFKPFAHD
ncbi:1868_t:CDS:2, partial [Acaulospora colombiana]